MLSVPGADARQGADACTEVPGFQDFQYEEVTQEDVLAVSAA